MSEKHLQRYVDEYVGRHNGRQEPTMSQISGVVKGMLGKTTQLQGIDERIATREAVGDLTRLS